MKSHRSLGPKEIPIEELVEALWELLHRLEKDGIDVGPKVLTLLKRQKLLEQSK